MKRCMKPKEADVASSKWREPVFYICFLAYQKAQPDRTWLGFFLFGQADLLACGETLQDLDTVVLAGAGRDGAFGAAVR